MQISQIKNLFDSNSFMPHGHCYLWRPDILWLNVGSDALIAISYFMIPVFLIYLVKKRKDLAFNWIFVMFALFIVACGMTHLMDIWTVWHPEYAMQGLVKLFTAGISFFTATALAPLMPKALALPSWDELKKINESLEERINEKTRDLEGMASIIRYSNDVIIGEDMNGRITSWNPAAQRLFGYTADEAVGMSVYDLVPEDRHREMAGIALRMSHSEIAEIPDTVRLAKDGRRIDVSLTFSPLKNAEGKRNGSSFIVHDITLRKQEERQRAKAEEKFRRVIEAAPNGLLMVDQKGKIALCNKEFEALFGYSREELVGHEMELLVPARFRAAHPGHRATFFLSPETRQMGAGRDLYGLRKDGSEFPVEIGLNPLLIEEGSFVLASIVDITKRKLLEGRIRHSAEAIQQKNQEMEQFVYTVSHDLKSPLVTSTGFLGLLKEDLEAKRYDKVSDTLTRLERANTRMGQLINDLLQLSRVGRIKLENENLDVNGLIEGICENLSAQISEKSVEIIIQPQMPVICADRKRAYQVFENLIINALKYASEGVSPRIEIGVKETEREFCFYVKDNGPGIAKEYHQKIFGLFQRLESDNKGTGVGLAIVSRAMQLHGGRVWVESALGEGATFWCAFPTVVIPQRNAEYEL